MSVLQQSAEKKSIENESCSGLKLYPSKNELPEFEIFRILRKTMLSLFLKEKYRAPTFTALRSKRGASKLKKTDLWTFPLKTISTETSGRGKSNYPPLMI
ncbi:hypothetical protein MAL04_20640 (plasmid) [Leptospira noguchii]|nr:hypothetical protein MAL04_20640 [Leptospira noguchii]